METPAAEASPEMPQPQGPEIPIQPPKEEKGGNGKLLAAIVIVLAVAGGAYYYMNFMTEAHYNGPTGAMVLTGADLPTGWWLSDKANVSTEAPGLVEGTATLSKKLEGGNDASTMFSWTWLFNSSSMANEFYKQITKESMTGDYRDFNPGDGLEGCNAIVKPLPPTGSSGDWTFITCRSGNLVWEVESRSTIGAAHLYAPSFAKEMAKKVAAAR
jgi:hypothetical protein